MPPPVYSTLLLHGGITGSGVQTAAVPDGFIWVVREISVITSRVPSSGLLVQVFSTSGELMYQVFPPGWSGTKLQHRRAVIASSGLLEVQYTVDPYGPGGAFVISGYQLSSP
jgi:hypothetical protein